MISSTLLLVLGGCLLGILQLLAGIAIGMWLRRSEADSDAAQRGHQDLIQASLIAKRLQALADDVSTSVGEHRTQLDHASQVLTSDEGRSQESLAELVVDVIDDIVRANHNLQSKLETAESRLQEQAAEIEAHISRSLTDPVTGLPNRREFDERLAERMSSWKRRREAFTLVLLDVDHFKRLNDRFGHVAGDRVLAAIGRALRTAVRREDAVARYGGEEFAVLLPSTSLEQGASAAQNVRETLGRINVDHNGQRMSVTVSSGLATIQGTEPAESLIQRADAALYAAKAAGRNCTFIHDGTTCRPAAGNRTSHHQPPVQKKPVEPAIPAASPTAGTSATTIAANSRLTSDEISPELALTCEELRRFVEERTQQDQAAPASRA